MMQDPSVVASIQGVKTQFPDEEKQQLKCPRCESSNTKFCYYNNYNLSQPRHFCKDCRRYWTKGGALRNVPVGGGTRKNSKRSATSSVSPNNPKRLSTSVPSNPPTVAPIQLTKTEPLSAAYHAIDPDDRMLEITGSFSSLLTSNGSFGTLMETLPIGGLPTSGETNRSIGASLQTSNDSSGSENPTLQQENYLNMQGDYSCWTGGWPDLAIYTPGSGFQ